jgi:hypothetical protein
LSVGLYDSTFLEKLQSWTKGTAVTIVGPDETNRLYQQIADNNNDSPIKLPFISLKRPGGFTILNTGKRPLTFDGATLDANYDKAKQLNGIPISIPYQLDIYTRYRNEADEYVRNIVFNIINYPKLDINIPYNGANYIHHSNIRLAGEIDDASSIPERLISGQFVRMSMKIDVDDAYLFDVRYRDVYSIELGYEWSDNTIEDDSKRYKLI